MDVGVIGRVRSSGAVDDLVGVDDGNVLVPGNSCGHLYAFVWWQVFIFTSLMQPFVSEPDFAIHLHGARGDAVPLRFLSIDHRDMLL